MAAYIEIKSGFVLKSKYVKAKTKALIDFGYNTLTEAEVEKQVDLIIKKKPKKDLSVIGLFCIDDFDY